MFTGYKPKPCPGLSQHGQRGFARIRPACIRNLPPYVCIPSMPTNFAGSGYLSSAYAPFSPQATIPPTAISRCKTSPCPLAWTTSSFHQPAHDARRGERSFRCATERPTRSRRWTPSTSEPIASSAPPRHAKRSISTPSPPKSATNMAAMRPGSECCWHVAMVAAGVRLVSLTYGGWDHHNNIKNGHAAELPQFDQGFATLVRSRSQRLARFHSSS